jgi:hypothetical protein
MAHSSQADSSRGRSRELRVGPDELVVRRRYELASIINDLMVGVWFVIGSSLFFFEATTVAGVWMFLIGSLQLLVRPLIRLTRNLHLRRVGTTPGGELLGSGHDF